MKKLCLFLLCCMNSLWCSEKQDFADKEQFKEAIIITTAIHAIANALKKNNCIKTVRLHEFTESAPTFERSTSAGFMCDVCQNNGGYNLVTIWGKTPIVSNIEYANNSTASGVFDQELIKKFSIIKMHHPYDQPVVEVPKFLYYDGVYLMRSIGDTKPTKESAWSSSAKRDRDPVLAGWNQLKEEHNKSKKDINEEKSSAEDWETV